MTEQIEYKGYWWRPDAPDKKVAGVLTYIPGEKIDLELIGAFDSENYSWTDFLERKSENLIHGITSNAKKITLVNCHPSGGSQNMSCPFPIMGYDCQFLIAGKHLNSFDQKCFRKAYVEFPVLKYWAPPTVIGLTLEDNGGTIEFGRSPESINSVDIDNNTQLLCQASVNFTGDILAPKVEQSTHLEIIKQADSNIEDFYSNIFLYEQFLSFATLQTVRCSKVSLIDETLYQETSKGDKYYHPVELMYIQREDSKPVDWSKQHFLFKHKVIADQYPRIIRKWYADKDIIAPIWRVLVDSIKHKRMFSSGDFEPVIHAIEGYWWRFRERAYRKANNIPKDEYTNLRTILTELLHEFDDVDKIRTLELNITAVIHSRDYYGHYVKKSSKRHAVDGWELYDLLVKLRKLLICCMLNFVGIDNLQINRILNDCNNRLLAR